MCLYETLEDSIVRDRIVIGERDDATRRKLLPMRKLNLPTAVDVCRASEIASRQLKSMASPEDVHRLDATSKRSPSKCRARSQRDVNHYRDKSAKRRCRYCDRAYELKKELCPAYGHVCRKCSKRNHFASYCMSKIQAGSRNGNEQLRNRICALYGDADEEF